MNAKELRAAAEYFADHETCECDHSVGIFNCIGCGIGRMAAYVLSTVRDDDDEAIEWTWLVSLGGQYVGAGSRVVFSRGDQLPIGFIACDDGTKAVVMHQERAFTTIVRRLKTRGDVRRLCSALGIELKEPQQ